MLARSLVLHSPLSLRIPAILLAVLGRYRTLLDLRLALGQTARRAEEGDLNDVISKLPENDNDSHPCQSI